MNLADYKKWFSMHQEATYRDLFTFLRFQTISADPKFSTHIKECADWLVDYLNGIGLDAEIWPTSGHPVVFAQHIKAGKDRPTLLIYQHYDVQPVDPLDLWESDPFEPTIRNENIYARGAQDNKGQCFYTITALKAFLESAESLQFNLKLFIEGEEEIGSAGTLQILKEKKKELQSDYLLVVDSGIPGPGIPAISLGIRGILTMDVMVRTADTDMHSGGMGGVAYNAIRALIQALSQCWNEKGKVVIPHFYEEVEELSEEEKKAFDLSRNEKAIIEEFGLRALCPEPGYTIGESVTIRPTFEINGINGGYTGEGFKTVLPAVASAKISCRLVPKQNPQKIFSNVKKHLEKHLPPKISLEITADHGSFAFRSDRNSLIAKRAAKGYEEVMGKPCKAILTGGSIPITVSLVEASGAEALVMGYGLDSDNIHAPNEHFGLDRFEQGFLTMGSILEQFNHA
jgi:acetylornithine deacetylase/succinyl-diaminopimelate desuccinylase-like protein